jgi:hypothetical protein
MFVAHRLLSLFTVSPFLFMKAFRSLKSQFTICSVGDCSFGFGDGSVGFGDCSFGFGDGSVGVGDWGFGEGSVGFRDGSFGFGDGSSLVFGDGSCRMWATRFRVNKRVLAPRNC